MVLPFLFPLWLILGTAGLEQAKNLAGESVKRNRHQCESATPSSRNAVSFSSARTTKRFPSRCASAIQIVRPSRSTAEIQPKLQPALLRLSAMISQYFKRLVNFLLVSAGDSFNLLAMLPYSSAHKLVRMAALAG